MNTSSILSPNRFLQEALKTQPMSRYDAAFSLDENHPNKPKSQQVTKANFAAIKSTETVEDDHEIVVQVPTPKSPYATKTPALANTKSPGKKASGNFQVQQLLSEFSLKLQEAEVKVIEAEKRYREAEARYQESEKRAQSANTQVQQLGNKMKEAEHQMFQAEENLKEAVQQIKLLEGQLKVTEKRSNRDKLEIQKLNSKLGLLRQNWEQNFVSIKLQQQQFMEKHAQDQTTIQNLNNTIAETQEQLFHACAINLKLILADSKVDFGNLRISDMWEDAQKNNVQPSDYTTFTRSKLLQAANKNVNKNINKNMNNISNNNSVCTKNSINNSVTTKKATNPTIKKVYQK